MIDRGIICFEKLNIEYKKIIRKRGIIKTYLNGTVKFELLRNLCS